jgi:uncharacterized Ntn-hydrolase superfamily protein
MLRSSSWILALACVLGACSLPATRHATRDAIPARPMHTYSIVARDARTGQLGVAVQTHWFRVGTSVPWAQAGVGAVATQSFTNRSFGPRGLALMADGVAPGMALHQLISADPGEAVRQVALIDAAGSVAVHTGARCIDWAGHHVGDGYSVQANLMLNARVVPAMTAVFEASDGLPLAERLLLTLEAAQSVGGDIRGQQSAALKVVAAEASDAPWNDTLVDLRVDDHADPLGELRRLHGVHRAYEHMNAGDAALEHDDMPAALREYAAARELLPGQVEVAFWNAFTLATNGHRDEALPTFREVFEAEPRWVEVLRRLPDSELIEAAVVREILAACDVP